MTYLFLGLLVVVYLYSAAYCLTALHYREHTTPGDVVRALTPIINTIIMLRDLRNL